MLDVVWLVVGVLLIAFVVADAVDTMVSNRVRWRPQFWITDPWLTWTWRSFAAVGRRLGEERRREAVLSTFAPFGLVSLILLWMVLLVLGWAFVWWALRAGVEPAIDDAGDAVYFSGVVLFTVGFGELVPVDGADRFVALAEALTGVVFGALVIGFLPSVYGAYAERERQLLLLDDLADDRLTPIAWIESLVHDGDVEPLHQAFAEWERWCALVLESHLNYPMLMWFRSQQRGQSWVTALGVVMDAAMLSLAFDEVDHGPARRLLRRGTRTLDLLSRRVRLDPKQDEPASNDLSLLQRVLDRLAATGVATRPVEPAAEELRARRSEYGGQLEALIDATLAPRGFWPSGGPVQEALLHEIPIRHEDSLDAQGNRRGPTV